MKPSKEYMEEIARRLSAMNPEINNNNIDNELSGYKMPSGIDQLGITAQAYLNRKADQQNDNVHVDPLFRNHN